MSEKQRFNKGIQTKQMAEKRHERWMSRKILTEIMENVRLQRDDANWVLYQVFEKENLTYKSKIKVWNHLMRAGYDLAKEKPDKADEISQKLKDNHLVQKTIEVNHKLYQQLNEAEELLEQVYTHITEKAVRTTWETKEDCKKFTEILDKIKKRIIDENNK